VTLGVPLHEDQGLRLFCASSTAFRIIGVIVASSQIRCVVATRLELKTVCGRRRISESGFCGMSRHVGLADDR
jgi:hypothetical protein